MLAEGLIVVPLYARQEPAELVVMMKDCGPSLILCGDAALRAGIAAHWADAPPMPAFDEVFVGDAAAIDPPQLAEADPVTIIYTSGTSGEAKGVMLTGVNVGHMLGCTSGRLDQLMQGQGGQDRVFHYLPFCFAGSWIMLLTCLLRGSRLSMSTDLARLAGDLRQAAPDYVLNVPQLLERMRRGIDEQLWKAGGFPKMVYSKAKAGWVRAQENSVGVTDKVWLGLAQSLVFPTIRKKMIGTNLKALICGSAPLNVDTQLFFNMLGIKVLQVYGLTETTAICTMDDPHHVAPGRVGPAIPGIEMKLGENEEILVHGPNIFPGYWNRPEESAKALRGGWFHSGDQGEVDPDGNWKIVGRIKNLIVLASGHNVPPEPIEDAIAEQLPEAGQVVILGNARSYLSVLITGNIERSTAQAAIDSVNTTLPHYRQVRAFHIISEPFTIESGLLTANGKLKRDVIAARFTNEISEMYAGRPAV
jgi:long-chain acyl-CoA synthetase